jgi:hypothetical protein
MSRRAFIGGSLAAGATLALVGCQPPSTVWRDQGPPWGHSWDAADPAVVTYADNGASYSIPAATRIASVPDPIGAKPMLRDSGPFMSRFGLPPAPGPLWVPSSPSFGGRAAWQTDVVEVVQSYFTNFHSLLSPLTNPDDSTQYLGWAQPFWGAILVCQVPGAPSGGIDGNPGMTTMSLNPITIQTWDNAISTGPTIASGFNPAMGQAVFVMWQVSGAASWLEVNYTNAAHTLVTTRVAGGQGTGSKLNTLHSGWSHDSAVSCLGLAQGTATQAQTDKLRTWATPFLAAPVNVLA